MAEATITQQDIDAVFPKVAETIADALGCDVDDVKPNVSLIEDLDAESIDFLDMVFRLERAFKVKIPRGKIVENARGDLPEAEFEQKGLVTEKGLVQLKSYLAEVPAERFKTPMKVSDIPRLFTPATFAKLVSARSAKRRRLIFACRRAAFRHILPPTRSSTASPSRAGEARARHVRGAGAAAGVLVVPRRRGGGAARGMGVDGAHRLPRPARRGAGDRNALHRRRRSRTHARSRRRHRRLRRRVGRLQRRGVCRRPADRRAGRLPRTDAAGRGFRFARGTARALRAAARRRRARRDVSAACSCPMRRSSSTLPACRCARRSTYPTPRRSSAITFRAAPCFPRRCCSTRRSGSRPDLARGAPWRNGARAASGARDAT